MELTWINKLRIAAVAGLGMLVLGLWAWPLAAPADLLAPVRAGSISFSGTLILLLLAFALGGAAYFLAWPHGREIGILAVPFGLAVWAGRSGPMRILMQASGQPRERAALEASLRFESFYWLLLVAAGFVGVLLAQRLRRAPSSDPQGEKATTEEGACGRVPDLLRFSPANLRDTLLSGVLAIVAMVPLTHFLVGVFAQDVATSGNLPPTQPPVGQILFAVLAAFAVAGFLVKKFADLSYVWPMSASAFLPAFGQALYDKAETVQRFAATRPATFFPHSALAVLPVQLVALGTLGAVLGYWMAVRYNWWRQHECDG